MHSTSAPGGGTLAESVVDFQPGVHGVIQLGPEVSGFGGNRDRLPIRELDSRTGVHCNMHTLVFIVLLTQILMQANLYAQCMMCT